MISSIDSPSMNANVVELESPRFGPTLPALSGNVFSVLGEMQSRPDQMHALRFELDDTLTMNNSGTWMQQRFDRIDAFEHRMDWNYLLDDRKHHLVDFKHSNAHTSSPEPHHPKAPPSQPKQAPIIIASRQSYGCLDRELESLL